MCIIVVNINLIQHIQQVNLQMHSTVSILYSQILKSTKNSLFHRRQMRDEPNPIMMKTNYTGVV